MNTESYFSPAKINLNFRIHHRRSDGYHEIDSLYQAVSLFDLLTVRQSSEDQFTCSDPSLACDSSNLVIQARNRYREQTGWTTPVSIYLDKKIPIQAGLGGGSSNAATTLYALNRLNPCPISERELTVLAGSFSSDAPFFFSSGTAHCTGRGEKIASLPPLEPLSIWIAKPNEGLSTAEVYKAVRCELLPSSRAPFSYFNDLEQAAFTMMPRLLTLRDQLLASGFETVVMSGSGTAFFCIGNLPAPVLPDVRFYPVSFLNRKGEAWYNLPEVTHETT